MKADRRGRAGAVLAVLALGIVAVGCGGGSGPRELLVVSYDTTRELLHEWDAGFVRERAGHGDTVAVRTSHGGSGAQARAVIDGLEADIVLLALQWDVDAIAKAGLIARDWRSRDREGPSVFFSTIVFVVRQGNPKHIVDWDDLIRPDVQVVTPNPKTSGAARWSLLAAWLHARERAHGDEAAADAFVRRLYANVPVLDTGARAAFTSFARREIGDVLLAWESETALAQRRGEGALEIVRPADTILAEPCIAIVDENVDAHGTRDLAEAYVRYLRTREAQETAARLGFRPSDGAVLAEHADTLPSPARVHTISEVGGWAGAQRRLFASGTLVDQLSVAGSHAQARP